MRAHDIETFVEVSLRTKTSSRTPFIYIPRIQHSTSDSRSEYDQYLLYVFHLHVNLHRRCSSRLCQSKSPQLSSGLCLSHADFGSSMFVVCLLYVWVTDRCYEWMSFDLECSTSGHSISEALHVGRPVHRLICTSQIASCQDGRLNLKRLLRTLRNAKCIEIILHSNTYFYI